MNEALLDVRGLTGGYGDVQVLWNVDLAIRKGEIVALIGSNGAGKSTLLRVLSGLLPPWGGSVTLAGQTVTGLSAPSMVLNGVVHVPEGRRLFGGLSVYDNLLLGAYQRREGKAAVQKDLQRVYELFPRLAERRWQDATTLSGGEQQMCAIGRGLMAAPRLLLIDELSLGLAPKVVEDLIEALRQVNAQGTSLLVVEQDVMNALDLAGRAYVLDHGRTGLHGLSADLASHPAVKAAYLGM